MDDMDDMDLEVDQRIARYWERKRVMLAAMEGKTIRSVASFRDGFYAGVAYAREMRDG